MTAAVDIVNRALEEIASQSQIVTLADGTPESIAASDLYQALVNTVLRETEPEFARRTTRLQASQVAASVPWAFAYMYPDDCVRVLQVIPSGPAPNDPQPMRWSVQADQVAGTSKIILTAIAVGAAVYTSSAVNENQWDALFTETVVRMLASELAMPIGGRPDFAKQKLMEAGALTNSAGQRDS